MGDDDGYGIVGVVDRCMGSLVVFSDGLRHLTY